MDSAPSGALIEPLIIGWTDKTEPRYRQMSGPFRLIDFVARRHVPTPIGLSTSPAALHIVPLIDTVSTTVRLFGSQDEAVLTMASPIDEQHATEPCG
jgi:hypothetical protein